MSGDGRRHPFTELEYRGERIAIDTEIVPLMKLLWSHDLDTTLSCQDQGGWEWVELEGPSAEGFVSLVAAADRELAAGVLGLVPCEVGPDEFDAYKRDHAWRYSALPLRRGVGKVEFVISVRFPRSDLDGVVAALEKAREMVVRGRGEACNDAEPGAA